MKQTRKANKYKKVGKTWPNGPESTLFCIYSLFTFFAIMAALLPYTVLAAVQITQVMYDLEGADTGREWIKITNMGSDPVDVGSFRLLEAGVHHKLVVVQGSSVLAPGTSAIIADNAEKFLADTSGYPGVLFDSSFSLSNTGETLVLKDAAGNIEDSYSYTAPVVAKPAPKKVATTPKQTTSSATSSTTSAQTNSSSKVVTGLPATQPLSLELLAWLAGLGSLMMLGIAGVVFARQERVKMEETKGEAEEFTIIDN